MSDLISRSALAGYIEEQIEESKEERSAIKKREDASSVYFYSGEISALKRMKRNIDMFASAVDAVPVVRCRDCMFFQERHVRTEDGQMKSYDEFPPEAFSRLGTGDVTSDYGINVGSQCLVDCNRGYGEDKTVFRQPDDYCSRGVRKMGAKMDAKEEE